MAAAEVVEIYRGGTREDKLTNHEGIAPDDSEALRERVHGWLRDKRWDRSLWHRFTIRADGKEVRA